MAKATTGNAKIQFSGSKMTGRHNKSYGPKQERPKQYRGQGR